MAAARDFSTISPSAKSLLLVKAQTSQPYAREAATRLFGAGAIEAAEQEAKGTPSGAGRRTHFELRARSLDLAIEIIGAKNILELAAGLSFRGLALAAQRREITYLDTDLPAMIETKASLIQELHPAPLAGTLRLQALDALDANGFLGAVRALPAGPVAIIEEGLLMYLDRNEKAHLAATVRQALLERGGTWVTADIYIRTAHQPVRDKRTQKFLEQHRVEENKFSGWSEAAAFFEEQGFDIARRLSPESDPWPVRETWLLQPKGA